MGDPPDPPRGCLAKLAFVLVASMVLASYVGACALDSLCRANAPCAVEMRAVAVGESR